MKTMLHRLGSLALALVLAACAPALTTTPARFLDEAQLRAHLFAFADDSMLGRRAGTEGGLKASRYLAAALERAGLEPGGEDGTFYQTVPLARVRVSDASTLTIAGRALRSGTDFVAQASRSRLPAISNATVVYLGTTLTDTTAWPSRDALRGRVVLVDRRAQTSVLPGTPPNGYLAGAAAVLVAARLDSLPAIVTAAATGLAVGSRPAGMPPQPPTIFISGQTAELAMGTPSAQFRVGATGAPVSGDMRMQEDPLPTHNVIAILRGSDPLLRNEYVVIGSHPDHVGTRQPPLDHDSLRAVLLVAEALGHQRGRRLSGAERAQLSVRTDTLVRAGPVRADSVFNGADDNGSGSIVMLALAESFARSGVRPRRSILFIWQHAEELGLLGSRHFTDYPTVPRESMVAAINLDMVGRGSAADIPGGGPRYVQVVGSRRLSTGLGALVERVNASLAEPMEFDYSMDAPGHPERIYCRSDHANYARYGIPVVFFTTGLHADYHQLTDEPQYIDYAKMRRVGALSGTLLLELANADRRPVVDGPVPDPFAPCRQ
jgi:hypothetical protein